MGISGVNANGKNRKTARISDLNMEETGFCYGCGRQIKEGLFCPKPRKCEEQYNRRQDRQIIKGKRASYGITGSTH